MQGDGLINALFQGIKGAQTPPPLGASIWTGNKPNSGSREPWQLRYFSEAALSPPGSIFQILTSILKYRVRRQRFWRMTLISGGTREILSNISGEQALEGITY